MYVYYLSDGEKPGKMEFSEVEANLRFSWDDDEDNAGFTRADELIDDISGALDMQGFWHGRLGVYNVVMVRADKIQELDK